MMMMRRKTPTCTETSSTCSTTISGGFTTGQGSSDGWMKKKIGEMRRKNPIFFPGKEGEAAPGEGGETGGVDHR